MRESFLRTWKRKGGRLVWLLCGAACMLALTGCHGSRRMPSFEMPETFDTSREYELTFWAKNDTNRVQMEIYNRAIEEFQNIYPNIRVNARMYTNYGDIYNDVITNISTGTTPNICITYPDHIATYLEGENTVVSLDGLIDDPGYGLGGSEVRFDTVRREEMVPQFLEECRIGDHIYALPYMRSTEACYVNKSYVEALGYELPEVLTWDFVWEVSEAAMKKDDEGNFLLNGQKVLIPFIYKSTDNMMIQMLHQRKEGYSTEQGDILLFGDHTRQLLYEIAGHGRTRAFSTFKISSYPANFLNAGQCIFAVDSTAGATWMGTDAPLCDISPDKIVSFETAVRMVPQYDPEDPSMISQGPSVCLFNKDDPQEVLAAWLFAQYLLTDDVQIAYAETEGYVPVTGKAQDSRAYQEYLSREGEDNTTYYSVKLQATKLLLGHLEDTFVTPVFPSSASLRDGAGLLIESVVKSARRNEPVDEASLDKLFREVSSLYRLDQRATAGQKTELGPLPMAAKALLATLGVVWLGILLYLGVEARKKPR